MEKIEIFLLFMSIQFLLLSIILINVSICKEYFWHNEKFHFDIERDKFSCKNNDECLVRDKNRRQE